MRGYLGEEVHEEVTESTQRTKHHIHISLRKTPLSVQRGGGGERGRERGKEREGEGERERGGKREREKGRRQKREGERAEGERRTGRGRERDDCNSYNVHVHVRVHSIVSAIRDLIGTSITCTLAITISYVHVCTCTYTCTQCACTCIYMKKCHYMYMHTSRVPCHSRGLFHNLISKYVGVKAKAVVSFNHG